MRRETEKAPVYVILWEYLVKPGHEEEFERIYGPDGDWARFFAKGKGYVSTELHRDVKESRRYATLDYWRSQAAYQAFRQEFMDEYRAIDQRCEDLTERETPLGSFLSVPPR